MQNKITQLLIGILIAAVVWFVLLPLLSGVVYTAAVWIFVLLIILWLLRLGGIT